MRVPGNRYLPIAMEGRPQARLEQLRRQHVAVLDVLDAAGWERTGGVGSTARAVILIGGGAATCRGVAINLC